MIQIKSIEELQAAALNQPAEGFISLNGGLRSSKTIQYMPVQDKFWILNEIDDTEQELTSDELSTESNIGEAIQKGAFYLYE